MISHQAYIITHTDLIVIYMNISKLYIAFVFLILLLMS